MVSEDVFSNIISFLPCRTPQQWIDKALDNIPLLLLDHAHCEKKAATTALSLISKYPSHIYLVEKLSCIAREELVHFEKVLKYLKKRRIDYQNLSSGRYARTLHALKSSHEPYHLIDSLLIAAIIEARSCERFLSLSRFLQDDLKVFYSLLAQAEVRHYEIYLNFAKKVNAEILNSRLQNFLKIEQELILTPEDGFRFHSGVPIH